MSDLLQRIGELKTQAKNRRDLKRYDRAAALLKQAIDLASKEYETSNVPEWRATLVSELADCWGILGGIERRWALDQGSDATQRLAHLRASIQAYDMGFRYESDPVATNTSTYNGLNRLLVRVLLNPERLAANTPAENSDAGDRLNVRAELERIAHVIEANGTDSVWAAADLALVNVLLGRQDAAAAYTSFERKQPADFACQSALDGVLPFTALDIATAPELKSAANRLATLRDRLNAG